MKETRGTCDLMAVTVATEDADMIKVPMDDKTLDSVAEPRKPHQKLNLLPYIARINHI